MQAACNECNLMFVSACCLYQHTVPVLQHPCILIRDDVLLVCTNVMEPAMTSSNKQYCAAGFWCIKLCRKKS